MSEQISIALVDDDPLMRELLSRLLEQSGIRVVWTASNAESALGRLREAEQPPDVLAVDVNMPGMNGHELTRLLLKEFNGLTVVMLTALDDPNSLSAALHAGAAGYLVKTDPPESIAAGLRAAASGLSPFSPKSVTSLGVKTTPQVAQAALLTSREQEILELLPESLTNRQIARRLQISEETVKHYVSAILHKLDVPDRVGAIMWGVRSGLLR